MVSKSVLILIYNYIKKSKSLSNLRNLSKDRNRINLINIQTLIQNAVCTTYSGGGWRVRETSVLGAIVYS